MAYKTASPHDMLKAQALRFGFQYDARTDQWISDSGARIPARVMNNDKLLELMMASANLDQQARDQITLARPEIIMPPSKKRSSYEKLAVRLDLAAGETFPFEHIHIVESSSEICVLIKHQDKIVLLRDDVNLFPSDTLLASIRLLQ